jgi:hypothetical protein
MNGTNKLEKKKYERYEKKDKKMLTTHLLIAQETVRE